MNSAPPSFDNSMNNLYQMYWNKAETNKIGFILKST